jgi:glycosyltransferase involved in cell wall biosynthesis
MHLVSIIIPVYNTEKYLIECLESVKNQSYKRIEVLLINDGSTDYSEKICKSYVNSDIRFKYFFQENQGLSSARNLGLEMMKGDFICFIDSDDFIEFDFIETLLYACLNNNVKVASCGRTVIENNVRNTMFTISYSSIFTQKIAIQSFLKHVYFDGSVCDKIFHTDLFICKRFIVGRIAEDLPITVEILLDVENIYHVGKPLYNYYKRSNSITTRNFKKEDLSILDSAKEVVNKIINKYPDFEELANSYYFIYILYIFDSIYISSSGKINIEEYNKIRFIIDSNIYSILINRELSFRNKIYLLIYFLKIHSLRNIYLKLVY